MSIAYYPPATHTTLGLLDRWCLGVPTSQGEFLIPCSSEEFARGALCILQSLDPVAWESLAAGLPHVPAAAQPMGVGDTQVSLTAPSVSRTVAQPPRAPVSTLPFKQPKGAVLPDWAPQDWEGVKALGTGALDLFIRLNAAGYPDNRISTLYGQSAAGVLSRRQRLTERVFRERQAATDLAPPAPETPDPTPNAPEEEAPVLEPQVELVVPEPVALSVTPYETPTPRTPLYELGRRGMEFGPACRALRLEPNKDRHKEWKEGAYDRALEE